MMIARIPILTSLAIIPIIAATSSFTTATAGGNDVACEVTPDQVDDLICGDDQPELDGPLAAPGSQDLACDSAANLTDFVTCVRTAAPASDSELYVFPTVAQSQDFADVVADMMSDMDCSTTIPTTSALYGHYRISAFTSNGRQFCILHEYLDAAPYDGTADLGWGTFMVAPDAHNELCIQAPHIRVDLYTEWEVGELFELAYARSALLGGAHRRANSAPSICEGYLTENGNPYFEADAAHNVDTFYAASKAVAAYYGATEDENGLADFLGADPDFHVLQFHGMGVSTCDDIHVFMSNGDRSDVLVGDGAQRLADALQDDHPEWNVAYRGDGDSDCNSVGSRNTFGRLANGIPDDGNNDINNLICSYPGVGLEPDPYYHPNVSARFIHIEQKRCINGTSCHRGDADGIREAAYWADAVARTFGPATCTNGIQDVDEDDIDCGGSCLPCPAPCVPSGEGMPCTSDTDCCSGLGSCTHGKPSLRVCL